jgi:hypothetical protein
VRFNAHGGAQFDEIVVEVPAGSTGMDVRHEIGETVGDRVEFVLHRLVASRLAVLQQRHHQEGDDRRDRVDDELPGVDIA